MEWKSRRKSFRQSWKWYLLAHVCHRWRQIVFASPRRLNLRIPCTRRTPVTKNLGIWPPFPIDVDDGPNANFTHEANVLAALRYIDRVYHVRLSFPSWQMGTMATAMQEPFPMLTKLYLTSSLFPQPALDLPAGFLGGSAPCLQEIGLSGISFPALPTLLLSTKDLVKLDLSNVSLTSEILPEAMVASLVGLPKLETFVMKFLSYNFRPDHSRPPVIRTILPALAFFVFRGASEYLEDLVGRIDGPRLNHISIATWYQPVAFQVAQLSRFIDDSVGPELVECRHAKVSLSYPSHIAVTLTFCHRPDDPDPDRPPIITYENINWRSNPISKVFSQFPATLSNVIHLQVTCHPDRDRYPFQGHSVDFLHQFSAVQTLLVTWELVQPIASMLEHLSEVMVTEMLPSLKLICFCCEGSVQVNRFVAARRHSNRPVTVVNTRKEFREICESYDQ
jgi:hypothetical protein